MNKDIELLYMANFSVTFLKIVFSNESFQLMQILHVEDASSKFWFRNSKLDFKFIYWIVFVDVRVYTITHWVWQIVKTVKSIPYEKKTCVNFHFRFNIPNRIVFSIIYSIVNILCTNTSVVSLLSNRRNNNAFYNIF